MSYLYPYGDTQQLNLSWFLAKFKELYEYITNLDPDDIALATVLSRFTNEYNSSTNYIPGDYTIHEGFIYKANQSTTGNFNPEAWDAALPVNDIQGLRILLGGMSTDLTDLEQNAVTNVQYTPGAATADGLLRQTKNGTAETVMTVDKEPTANSQNPVKSGAVQAGIAAVSQAVGSERTDRQNADNSLQDQIDDLNDITGDGVLSGFTATDLTGAANELKGSLNANESAIAIVADGNTHPAIASGEYVFIRNHSTLATGLYKAIAAIPLNNAISSTNVTDIQNGGLNDATKTEIYMLELTNKSAPATLTKQGKMVFFNSPNGFNNIANGYSLIGQITNPNFLPDRRTFLPYLDLPTAQRGYNSQFYIEPNGEVYQFWSGEAISTANNGAIAGVYITN